ncbi:hypothetical protein AB0J72_42790 [Dactylosporangium sp. NPDC049742]|uniref:DUF6928 family protein n=1 Tax=Dactylosporangium sp. NPDC049742 TaxID=3154737 RepID=UPI00343B198A
MGAKTAALAYSDGEVAKALQGVRTADPDAAAALVRRLWPDLSIEPGPDEEPWTLAEAMYPPEGTVCALAVPGLDLVCDQRIAVERPSLLTEHLVAAGAGRRMYLHAMHSVVDWVAFAVWDDGRLVRSLSVAPDFGIIEDIGDRLPFEAPYWAGAYPVEDYPLPFHPLNLGERALVEFFGFYAEGLEPGEGPEATVDEWEIEVPGFRIVQ